jgi:CubicO group peptidase (beta-lactamase class C family)
MDRRHFLVATACAGAAATASALPLPPQTSSPKALTTTDLMDVTRVPGIAVVGKVRGKAVSDFSGVCSAATKHPVTRETIFPAASLSKVVFAWAVMDLVDAGKLAWDKPLSEYAELALTGPAARITAQHALTHTTGLVNWRFKESDPLQCSFEPGTKWSYSGEGIFLLQRVVEKIADESVAAYMKSNVLPELGIKAGTFAWTPKLLENAAIGHQSNGEVMEKSLAYYERSNYDVLTAAGLDPATATIDQITAAYHAQKKPALPIIISPNMAGSLWLKPEEYASFAGKVLVRASMHPQAFESKIDVNKKIGWTIGWGVDHSAAQPALFSYGDGPGTKNLAWIEPHNDTAVCVFTNGERGADLYSGVLRRLLGADAAVFYWV